MLVDCLRRIRLTRSIPTLHALADEIAAAFFPADVTAPTLARVIAAKVERLAGEFHLSHVSVCAAGYPGRTDGCQIARTNPSHEPAIWHGPPLRTSAATLALAPWSNFNFTRVSMRPIRPMILCIAATLLTGCAAQMAAYRAEMLKNAPQTLAWDISLKEVERPAKARERYGEQVIASQNDSGVTRYSFEDQLVHVLWLATGSEVHFSITNKTDYSIKIIWNDAAFVDPAGKSSAVMHEGVKYTDCAAAKTASIVVRRGSADDVVIPCTNVSFGYSSWIVSSYLKSPDVTAATADAVGAELRASEVGKTVQVLLPLQIEDVVNDYLFTFEVKGLTIKPRQS